MLLDTLKSRGFVNETTNDHAIEQQLTDEKVVFYAGFDPTASSLHIGNLSVIMLMNWLQRAGHSPLVLVGGATAMIGDPSGKNESRRIMQPEDIARNMDGISSQLARFMDMSPGNGVMVNNADWIMDMRHIDFLREIGSCFQVNRMIRNRGYAMRLESNEGLSFLEFSYQLLQAYDFLVLHRDFGCTLQLGGSDQWSNILAGIDLIRRKTGKSAHGLTLPLVTTSSGAKMGKTAEGAVWLDPNRTSPYDFYQYWVNVDDGDVARFLRLYTFLEEDEILEYEKLQGADLREAKQRLAHEATALCHGEDEARRAATAATSLFVDNQAVAKDLPGSSLTQDELLGSMDICSLFHKAGLTRSRSEAIRLVKQGGTYLNGKRISQPEYQIDEDDIVDGKILLRRGKKNCHVITVEM